MNYEAEIILDSLSPTSQVRLTTMRVVMPRFILAQFNTHRKFSRNAASSRALPLRKIIEERLGFVPEFTGKTASMTGKELDPVNRERAEEEWRLSQEDAIETAKKLDGMGVHKSICNRLLEPYMWTEVLVSSTEWDNFFSLRCSDDAQPEMQIVANKMLLARAQSQPIVRGIHLPYFDKTQKGDEGNSLATPTYLNEYARVSMARCARVSTGSDFRSAEEELVLYNRLVSASPMHISPAEHIAVAGISQPGAGKGNFDGDWAQFRFYLESRASLES